MILCCWKTHNSAYLNYVEHKKNNIKTGHLMMFAHITISPSCFSRKLHSPLYNRGMLWLFLAFRFGHLLNAALIPPQHNHSFHCGVVMFPYVPHCVHTSLLLLQSVRNLQTKQDSSSRHGGKAAELRFGPNWGGFNRIS